MSDDTPDPAPLRYNAWVYPTTENRAPDRWLTISHRRRQPNGTITIGYGYDGGGQEVTLDAATAVIFAKAILEIVGGGER